MNNFSTFSKQVELETENISSEITAEEILKRRDFRNIITFTIDPEDAKDFDDALSIQILANGNYEVGIHIADVTHYVKENTEIDLEAKERGTSIYLVDKVIPMLPERLSNDLCSLRPHENKLCFSAVFEIDENVNILSEWFGRTVIYSDHRFTYESAQDILEGKDHDYKTELLILNDLAKKMRKIRFNDGAIGFDKQEMKFRLNESGFPVEVYTKIAKDSNKLIEEFMLLANKKVAAFIKSKDIPCVNRVHGEPNLEKLNGIKEIVNKLGHEFSLTSSDKIKANINKLILDVKDLPEETLINTLLIRSQQKAYYSTNNLPHYGLGFNDYSHFTSPIRRMADIHIHRILTYAITKEKTSDFDILSNMCSHISDKEVEASELERESIKIKQIEFLQNKIGTVYEAIVSGVTEWGIYVEILENKCEGIIRLKDIKDDYYKYDAKRYLIYGKRTKKSYRLGDKIMIKLTKADIMRKTLEFAIFTS